MGWTDFFEDVGDAVSDIAESAYDAVASGGVGRAIGAVGRAADAATFGLAGRAMNAADDYVFDTVDYVTGGAVDVDFDGGQLTVGAGFEGLVHAGASVGEDGIGASSEALAGGFDLAMTERGFTAGGAAGLDYGPLPYADGHVELLPNGDVRVNGHVQGTLPTPYGLLSGEATGGFASTAEGWGGYLDSRASLRMPNGVTLGESQHLAYQQTADGSQLSVGVEGSIAYQGVGTAHGGIGYERVEHDGDVVEGVHIEGDVDALGVSAHGSADYRHAVVDGVERSDWSSAGDVDGPDLSTAARLATRYAASELGGSDGVDGATGLTADDLMPTEIAQTTQLDSAIDAADAVEQTMDDLVQDLP